MELSDRISLVMKSHNLTASAFAERLGVQRSSISHIMGGRNRPSIDFLQKLLRAFPKVDATWLLLGDETRGRAYSLEEPEQEDNSSNDHSGDDEPISKRPQTPQPVKSEKQQSPVAIALIFEDGTYEYIHPRNNG